MRGSFYEKVMIAHHSAPCFMPRKAIGYRKPKFPEEIVEVKLEIRSFSGIQRIQLLAARLGRDR
jgi:hypothetical protein